MISEYHQAFPYYMWTDYNLVTKSPVQTRDDHVQILNLNKTHQAPKNLNKQAYNDK